MNASKKALAIFSRTNDGNNLAPQDLTLVEMVVNDRLNEAGRQAFEELYAKVLAGEYDKAKVYLHGVEHVTKDGQGYVYWKGTHVEHFSHRNSEEEKKDAQYLANKCKMLEAKGITPNSATAVWEVEKHLTKEELENCKTTAL